MSDQNELLPQEPWFSRNWKWVVPTSFFLLLGVVILYILSEVGNAMGTAVADPDLIGTAEKRAQEHPDVQIYFGQQPKAGNIIEGNATLSEDGTSIAINVPFKGELGSGMMDIYAHKVEKNWVHDSINVRLKKPKKRTIKLPN